MHKPERPRTRVDNRAAIRLRSKRLFGNADRLEVAVAVAQSTGVVHAQELADDLGISSPRVRAQLLAFAEAGLLHILPRTGLVQNYERLEDPFWSAAVELVAAWDQPPTSIGLKR